jgi:hypothetical protein
MKKAVLRYGYYAALAELIFFVFTWLLIWLFKLSHSVQGYIGWADLICPLVFIYFGIRYYRDQLNDGEVSFLKALQIGLLITLIAACAYAIIETVYVLYIDPDFYANIAKYDLEQYKKTLSAAAYAAKAKAMKAQLAISNNPFYNFMTMIMIIASLGTIVTVISSALLFKREKLVEV